MSGDSREATDGKSLTALGQAPARLDSEDGPALDVDVISAYTGLAPGRVHVLLDEVATTLDHADRS